MNLSKETLELIENAAKAEIGLPPYLPLESFAPSMKAGYNMFMAGVNYIFSNPAILKSAGLTSVPTTPNELTEEELEKEAEEILRKHLNGGIISRGLREPIISSIIEARKMGGGDGWEEVSQIIQDAIKEGYEGCKQSVSLTFLIRNYLKWFIENRLPNPPQTK